MHSPLSVLFDRLFVVSLFASALALAGCAKQSEPAANRTVPTQASAASTPTPEESFASLITETVRKHGLVGMCAALIAPGVSDRVACAGKRRIDRAPELGVDDIFHLGSDTKAFTATLAAMLVEDGLLRWDSTLSELFGDLPMHADLRAVTLSDLLTHRGGINGKLEGALSEAIPFLWSRTDSIAAQRRWFVEQVLAQAPVHAPRTAFLYSNQGYVLAGAMLERAAKQSWEELITQRIFRTLDMKSCGFGAPQNVSPHAPFGHVRGEGGSLETVPAGVQADNPAALGPAGTIHCNLRDWGRFLAQHMAGESGGSKLLSAESWKTLHTPPPFAPRSEGSDYAMGWIVVTNPKTHARALTHAGSNTTFYAETWTFPASGRGYMVALNQADEVAQTVANDTIAALFALEPPLPQPPVAATQVNR